MIINRYIDLDGTESNPIDYYCFDGNDPYGTYGGEYGISSPGSPGYVDLYQLAVL